MENIAAYCEGCKKVRKDEKDLYSFVTVDLFEGKNLSKVFDNLLEFMKQIAPQEHKKIRGVGAGGGDTPTSSLSSEKTISPRGSEPVSFGLSVRPSFLL